MFDASPCCEHPCQGLKWCFKGRECLPPPPSPRHSPQSWAGSMVASLWPGWVLPMLVLHAKFPRKPGVGEGSSFTGKGYLETATAQSKVILSLPESFSESHL